MSDAAVTVYTDIQLPSSVVSRVDISRLVSEAEKLDADLTTAAVHAKAGVAHDARPELSQEFEALLVQNKLPIASARERRTLIELLHQLKDNAPVIHMTFAVKADRVSLGKLVQWLRTSVHQQAVISVGLQPDLIAGVYLRTPNHVHDLSLRSALANGRSVITEELEALRARG